MKLYSSEHFSLNEIRSAGKKEIPGILCFKGLPSVFGSSAEVLAIEDGVVVESGKCNYRGSRKYRLGSFVTIACRNGVSITYGRLACRFAMEGDKVKKGDCIGIEGSSGSGQGEYLTLEFRRNGRRVDGCDYLGIPHIATVFTPKAQTAVDIVAGACKLSDEEKEIFENSPEASRLCSLILPHLASVAPLSPDSYALKRKNPDTAM